MQRAQMNASDIQTEQVLLLQAKKLWKYQSEHTQFNWTMEWAKELVARIYGFRHWFQISHHMRTSCQKSEDVRFNNLELHPKTMEFFGCDSISILSNKKSMLLRSLEVEDSPHIALSDANASIYDNLIFAMHGFSSPHDFSMRLRYHFFDSFISLYDHIAIVIVVDDNTTSSPQSLKEILLYHQDFGDCYVFSELEFFEPELKAGDLKSLPKVTYTHPFEGWSLSRLFSLVSRELKALFGSNIHNLNAIRLSEVALTIFACTSREKSLSDFIKLLNLDNLAKSAQQRNIPESVSRIAIEYLNKLPGYKKGDGFYKACSAESVAYHNQIAMMVSQSLTSLTDYFKPLTETSHSSLYFYDTNCIKEIERNIDREGINFLLKQMKNASERSLFFLSIEDKLVFTRHSEEIESIAIDKSHQVLLWNKSGSILDLIDVNHHSLKVEQGDGAVYHYSL